MAHHALQARRKEVKKRRLGSVRMHLSSGLGGGDSQIALSIYKTVGRSLRVCLCLSLSVSVWVRLPQAHD